MFLLISESQETAQLYFPNYLADDEYIQKKVIEMKRYNSGYIK